MKRLTQWTMALLLLLPTLGWAESGIIKKNSDYDVKTTMDRLEAAVREKGMTVFARIDHQQNAAAAGMEMSPSEVLIFGNPKAGTRIMLRDPAAGLDLPLRVLVHQDSEGKTWLSYHAPEALKQDYALAECVVLPKVSQALEQLTGQATH